MDFTPRYYQQDAVDKTVASIAEKQNQNPLIICPTGSGKSHILAMLCDYFKQSKILVVSHVKEILEQDLEKLEHLLGALEVGVYSAGMKRKESNFRVTVAGVQSVYKKAALFQDVQYIIIDEAHKIPKGGGGMYIQLFNALPDSTVIIGLTATGYRLGSGYLHKGKDKLFDYTSYEVDIVKLIKEGYLSPLITKNANMKLDTKKLKIQAGDFSEKDMADRFDKFGTTNKIVEELSVYRLLYKHWLLFAINIEHATHLYEALTSAGIKAEMVHSKRTIMENDYAIWAYKKGIIQCLISIEKMTTGFDAPHTDLIALVRPTKSPVLHVQIIGRGLRTHPGKEHCLILDFAGNLDRLGPINDVHVPEPGKKGTGEAPLKCCPECNTHVPAGANVCYICGYIFPKIESRDLSSSATSSHAIRGDKQRDKQPGNWMDVSAVAYVAYTSNAGKLSMQVRYRCGLRTISEWLSFGRDGFAGRMAEKWWDKHTKWRGHPEYTAPRGVNTAVSRALNGELHEPKSIYVEQEGDYPKIKSRVFT